MINLKSIHQSLKIKINLVVKAIILFLILVGLCFVIFQKRADVSKSPAESLIFYNFKTTIEEIKTSDQEGVTLPNELIIKPGIYQIGGKNYAFQNQGLYRILWPEETNQERIVFDGNIEALMSAVAWIFSHGDLDNGQSFEKLEKKALTEKLITTCGDISAFVQKLLAQEKIESRIVKGMTQEEYNGYDDSHIMVEVKVDGRWRLYDLDNNAVFKKNGQYLNYYDFQKLVPSGDYEIEKLASDTGIAILGFKDKKTGYNFSFYGEERFSSEETLKNWYKRVLQIPFIKEGNTYFYFVGDEKKVQSVMKNTKKISQDEFLKKFYD